MHILMVSSFLPYPLHSGGHIRLYNIIKRLAKKHTITLVAESRSHQTRADIDALRRYCDKIYTVERRPQWSVVNIVRAFFSFDSFLTVGHTLPEMRRIIEQELQTGDYDCVDVETFYIMQNVPQTSLPIVLTEHNIEYEAYEKFAYRKIPPVIRQLFLWDVWKMRRTEQQAWQRADAIMSVSAAEAAKIGPKARAIPNGYDPETFTCANSAQKWSQKKKKLLFIATFKWLQNIDACKFILQEVWPKIAAVRPDMELWIVGRDIPTSLEKIGGERVVFDRHAEDTNAVFHDAFALLFPAFIATGTSLKIIEAMATGLPVITTTLGIRGLPLTHNHHVLIGDTTEDIVSHVIALADDKKKYARIAKNAHAFATQHFTWDSIMHDVFSIFQTYEKNRH